MNVHHILKQARKPDWTEASTWRGAVECVAWPIGLVLLSIDHLTAGVAVIALAHGGNALFKLFMPDKLTGDMK